MAETGRAWDPVKYLSRRQQWPCPRGQPGSLVINPDPVKESDPLSPSRWATVQLADDAWGHLCLWMGEWTRGSLCRRPFAGECQHLECVPCSPSLLLHDSSVSECVVMSSGCTGRMSFPFPSIRKEVSETCGTPDTGRCKQTLCKGENRHMNEVTVT